MSIEVHVGAEGGLDVDVRRVEAWARAMLASLALEAPELSIQLVDDDAIRALNRAWRAKDVATDVLSFPQQEGEVAGGLLGDVVISVPTARGQALELGHALDVELRVLLSHGLAHLLGHDHEEPVAAARMAALEGQLLAAMDTPAPGLVERAGAAR